MVTVPVQLEQVKRRTASKAGCRDRVRILLRDAVDGRLLGRIGIERHRCRSFGTRDAQAVLSRAELIKQKLTFLQASGSMRVQHYLSVGKVRTKSQYGTERLESKNHHRRSLALTNRDVRDFVLVAFERNLNLVLAGR